MTRITTADPNKISGADFFAAVTGRPRQTPEQRQAEYRADIERYIAMIENGDEWAVPPPYLYECRRVMALREEAIGDPFLNKRSAVG
jgi:hypothetical protein